MCGQLIAYGLMGAGIYKIAETTDHLLLGGNVTLTDAMQVFLLAAKRPGFEYCAQLWQHFNLIANVPVRNVSRVLHKTRNPFRRLAKTKISENNSSF